VGDGFVYALDAFSGKEQWAFKTAGRVRPTPAIANGSVYTGGMDGTLYALDLKSGGRNRHSLSRFTRRDHLTGKQSRSLANTIGPEKCRCISACVSFSLPKVRSIR